VSGSHHHRAYFDPYSRFDSPVHHVPAAVKLFVAVALIVAIVSVPVRVVTAVTFFPAVVLVLVAVSGLSFVPPSFLLRRIAVMEPVVLGVAVLALFQPGGARVFVTLAVRGTLCIAVTLLLANTTPFADTLAVLRRLRVPALLVTTLALMYRYLFVLADESQRMRRARASRSFSRSRRTAWVVLATTVGQLFVRTADRAERIYLAMCARGWR
jgi:cobalt/nickel transport system permease protein